MANEADLAQDAMPEIDVSEISKQFEKVSEEYCIECGNDIPEKRRQLGGVERCIGCQTVYENKMKHYR